MAAGAFTTYNQFQKAIGDSTHDLDANTYKLALFLSTSNCDTATHTVLADLTNQHSNASGYTTGGVTLTSVTWNLSSSTATFDAADATFTASGGNIVARFGVIYRSGTVNSVTDALVGRFLLDNAPADVTVSNGQVLTLAWHASGIFTLARA